MGFLPLARSLLGILLIVACGGSSDVATSSTTASPQATTTSSTSTSLGIPTTTTTTSPTTSPTSATTTTTPPAEIVVEGDDDFVDHANAALDLLEAEAPDSYLQVVEYVDTIMWVPAGSGMDVFTRTFLAGEVTAYAPGYDIEDQRRWFAGTIAHDSCHSRLYATGQSYIGRDAELECLMDQLDALEAIDDNGVFVSYVQGLIDGVDEPGNDYWNDPDRHW